VLLVDALRLSGDSVISLVAEQAGRVVGHVLLSRLGAPMRALALAPVGVLPDHQGQGIGSALIRAALERAQDQGIAAVFVVGEPAFYQRFGFSVGAARAYDCPYASDYFMIRALVSDPLPTTGRIDYPPPFGELE
jgi:putative acetyltransferase